VLITPTGVGLACCLDNDLGLHSLVVGETVRLPGNVPHCHIAGSHLRLMTWLDGSERPLYLIPYVSKNRLMAVFKYVIYIILFFLDKDKHLNGQLIFSRTPEYFN